MPQHKSAEKRVGTNEKRRQRNQAVKTQIRRATKALQAGLKSDEAGTLLQTATSVLAKSAKKRVIKKKTASRRTSRLAKAVNRAKAAAK
ncbi:MAG: 30S ribosomal protein S20 [Candidatus Eisenbacteria bacterium]|nr:30S ribosomal protein S20 [Candidatus Eisenbacteria bacterium]MCC7141271.1 30S ribosomal protein S20 [Candidatus Eisenbacteria bacterium]